MAIVAAGGVVIGSGRYAENIALVRRHRYGGEVGLPKGKSKGNETPLDTALREVREETGLSVFIREFAGTTHYLVKGRAKSVFYFVMSARPADSPGIEDTGEIASVEWATPKQAMGRLWHSEDRILIGAVFGYNPWR